MESDPDPLDSDEDSKVNNDTSKSEGGSRETLEGEDSHPPPRQASLRVSPKLRRVRSGSKDLVDTDTDLHSR